MISKSKAIKNINKKYFNKGVSDNSLKNLKTDTKWSNLPTIAVRIPSVFKEEILDFAQGLDKENNHQLHSEKEIVKELKSILNTTVRKSQGSEILKDKIRKLIEKIEEGN